MNWNEYPVLRILLPFLVGIGLAYYFNFTVQFSYIYFVFGLLLFIALVFWRKKRLKFSRNYLIGIYLFVLMIFFGMVNLQNHFPYHSKHYLTNKIEKSKYFICKIIEPPATTEKSVKLIVNNIFSGDSIHQNKCRGKSILYLQKDSAFLNLKYGDKILILNKYQKIPISGNPYQFDYKRYLYTKGIEYQQYLKKEEVVVLSEGSGFNILAFTYAARKILLETIKKYILKKDEQAVAEALILGYRNDISDELQKAYSGAGAVHVLAVSGLHVGIIYMIFSKLLMFVPLFRRKKIFVTSLLLFIIWFFTFITGLSPSVLRAAVMFSFVIIGQSLKRPTSIYNSLAVSAFLLLCFNPFLIFDVGFQLSYAAVISIVAIQPVLDQVWQPENVVIKYFWSLITVSIAATIGTLPFTLFYFNQFPVMFIFSNMVVIPLAFVILLLGIILFMVSFINPLNLWIGKSIEFFVLLMNKSIVFLESLSFSVIRGIPFNSLQFVVLIFIIISLFAFITNQKKWSLFSFLGSVLVFVSSVAFVNFKTSRNSEMIIYNNNSANIVAVFEGRKCFYLTNASDSDFVLKNSFTIEKHKIMNRVNEIKILNFDTLFQSKSFYLNHGILVWKDKRIAFLNSESEIQMFDNQYDCDYLLLMDNSKIYPAKVFETYKPQQILFASTNSIYRKNLWEKISKEKGMSWYSIKDQGSFHLKIN